MLAKGLLPTLVACHAIDLVIYSLARRISAIHKQLPERQDMSSWQASNGGVQATHGRMSLKKLQLAMALCSPLVKQCLLQCTAPRLKWLQFTLAEYSTQ